MSSHSAVAALVAGALAIGGALVAASVVSLVIGVVLVLVGLTVAGARSAPAWHTCSETG